MADHEKIKNFHNWKGAHWWWGMLVCPDKIHFLKNNFFLMFSWSHNRIRILTAIHRKIKDFLHYSFLNYFQINLHTEMQYFLKEKSNSESITFSEENLCSIHICKRDFFHVIKRSPVEEIWVATSFLNQTTWRSECRFLHSWWESWLLIINSFRSFLLALPVNAP